MDWLESNWDSVVTALVSLHVLALFIVNLTPTPKDDEFVGKAYKWVERMAGLISNKAKEDGK